MAEVSEMSTCALGNKIGYLIGCVRGCNAPDIEKLIRTQVQNELDIAAGRMKRMPMEGGASSEGGDAMEEAVEAVVTAVVVEEEESTMGTHEIAKHVACLILKPDIIQQVCVVAQNITTIFCSRPRPSTKSLS